MDKKIETTTQKLAVYDGETLMDMRLPPTRFCVDTLLPQGLSVLGGAPKIGKSWLVLDLCIRIAKGEPLWNLPTEKGTTLYLCLEDTLRRVQERLNCITNEVPPSAFFATAAASIEDGLCEQIETFVTEHKDTSLVAVDTFQMVRGNENDTSYANDYADIQRLKSLADRYHFSVLLVHHLRKQGDCDPLNKLSGTTGITGAADAVFVLDKSKRSQANATLTCTGRDIEYRELELKFSKEKCVWEVESDSLETPSLLLPDEINKLIDFIKTQKIFTGNNTDFAEQYNFFSASDISAKALKQLMNKWRYQMEEQFVFFRSHRSNGQRLLDIRYIPPADVTVNDSTPRKEVTHSDSSDGTIGSAGFCVPCDPCVPASHGDAIIGDVCDCSKQVVGTTDESA